MSTECDIDDFKAHEASGPTFASLLHALATEYERVQHDNARLIAEITNRNSSLATSNRDDKAVQELPLSTKELENPQGTLKKQVSPSSNSSTSTPTNPENAGERQNVFELIDRWTEHPELLHHKLAVPNGHLPQTVRDLTNVMMGVHEKKECGTLRCLIIHPQSKIRNLWILGCITLLLFDLVFVPLDVCFDLEESSFMKTAHYVAMIFWTLDIIMNFMTAMWLESHVESRFVYIAKAYVKTWFFFDLFLVLSDYISLAFTNFPATHISILRMLRWGRFMRLFRLARLSKMGFLRPVIRAVAVRYRLSRTYVEVLKAFLFAILLMLICLHLESCFWHAFGASFEDGWIHANNLESASVGRLYTVSMHWSGSRLIGSNSRYALRTEPELVVDTLLMFMSLVLSGCMLADIAVLTIIKTTSKPFNLWRSSSSYSNRHELSLDLRERLIKWLEGSNFGNIGEIAEEEDTLLNTVPKSLRDDLLFEARVPFLAHKQFITDMARINDRTARHLCYAAMTEEVLASHEVIFDHGDAGQAMRFISHGSFQYECSFQTESNFDVTEQLEAPAALSEAVLWTAWEHVGLFRAISDPRLLILNHELFALTVKNYHFSLMHAVRYAKQFVHKLNQAVPYAHDRTEFDELSISFLNHNVFENSDERHFVFISHFKVEAGTEATLMFSEMRNQLMNDPGHAANDMAQPIFIDSENLTDLARLRQHIIKTDVLVLLLTPGVLSRPWCLIEIATAIKHHLKIVLVEIERPGCKFQYPDDQFYADFLAGKTLDVHGITLLESQGITLEKMAEEFQRIFQKISLPYSPHRKEEVREAEVHGILKRCDFECSNIHLGKP